MMFLRDVLKGGGEVMLLFSLFIAGIQDLKLRLGGWGAVRRQQVVGSLLMGFRTLVFHIGI